MKTSKKTAIASTPVTVEVAVVEPKTPTLDAVLAALAFSVPAWIRWTVEGWGQHLRASRHAVHAANSFAKHALDFVQFRDFAMALTVARCVDHGLTHEEARDLIEERLAARAAKAAA
jgi:hypothetical protein